MRQTPVALVQAQDYEPALIQAAVQKLFASLRLDPDLFREKRVLIKPNLLMRRRPEEATTTHPQVLTAVIRQIQHLGARQIVVADSPGGLYTPAQLKGIYSVCGVQEACEQTGAELNLEVGYGAVPAVQPRCCQEFNLIDPVRQADVVVSVGKLKTHCMTGLSGGVKNLFGCIPGLQKPQMHYRYQNKNDFGSMLVDLAQTVAPILTIMDAVESMEGDGPSGGSVRHTGCLIGSENPFCLDLMLSELIAMSPDQIPTVQESIRRGLCPSDFDELVILNPDSLPTRIPDYLHPNTKTVDFSGSVPPFLAPAVQWGARHLLAPRPRIDPNQCIGCGKCAESCPPSAIRVERGRAVIRYRSCIRCYCCHEMCPVRAIHIRGRS